jgi:hypothetical protein
LFGKGFVTMDAGIETTGMYLRRPLTGTPVPISIYDTAYQFIAMPLNPSIDFTPAVINTKTF